MSNDFDKFRYQSYVAEDSIAASDTTSAGGDLGNHTLSAVILSDMTGDKFTFKGSLDGDTYYDICKDGDKMSIDTVTGTNIYPVSPQDFAGIRFIQIVSDATETDEVTVQLVSIDAILKQK